MSTISELVEKIVEDDRLSYTVRQQEIALALKRCSDQTLGKWIEDFGLEFLRLIMPMDDAEIEPVLPKLSLSLEERVLLLQCLEDHASVCAHCNMKVRFDSELDGAISAGDGEVKGEGTVLQYYEAKGS